MGKLVGEALYVGGPMAVENARRDQTSSSTAQDGPLEVLAITSEPFPTGVASGQKVGGDSYGREDAVYQDHRWGT